jgi:branched-chain amino acid transport system permease protein
MSSLLSHLVSGALIGLLYALIAMGFVIIYRAGRVFNFAQGEVVVVSAFLIWTFVQPWELPMWVSLLLAFGASFLIGLVIERIILRPLVGEELFSLVMVTIGLLVFIRGLVLVIWGADVHFIPPAFSMKGVKLGPIMLDRGLVYGGILTIVMAILFSWFFKGQTLYRCRLGYQRRFVHHGRCYFCRRQGHDIYCR